MGDTPERPYQIRPARMDDHAAIASFTQDTFEWGDYIARVYKDWIADSNGLVLVAADRDDSAVAMAKVAMLSPTEAWAQGARVHPAHRRMGLATLISAELNTWARSRGAEVVRLLVENNNPASLKQVTSMEMRGVAAFVMVDREIGVRSPIPKSNGGRRKRAGEQLRTVPSAEAELALLSWQSGPMARAARGLFAEGWILRRLTVADLQRYAKAQRLWDSSVGSAISRMEGDPFWVGWVETRPETAPDFARALLDTAAGSGADRFSALIPSLPWLNEAFSALGCEIHPMTVFAKAL